MEGLNFSFPVKAPYEISKYYGEKHQGIDIVGQGYNSPILSISDGDVYKSFYDSIYGNQIIIRHQNDIYSMYSHLSNILVEQGTKVNKGQKIGTMGSTGMTTGVHLHFSIFTGDPLSEIDYEDPLKYLKK